MHGDAAARAVARSWVQLSNAVPGGWALVDGGATAAVTGIPVAHLNGVFVSDASRERVAALLDGVAASGLPHCMQMHPAVAADLAALAVERGMTRWADLPLMVLDSIDGMPDVEPPAGPRMRRLEPEEAHLHARAAAAGFEAPDDVFRRLMTPGVLRLEGASCYLGEVDGQTVRLATGFARPRREPAYSTLRRSLGSAVAASAPRSPPEW